MGLNLEQGKQEMNSKCNLSTLFCLLGGDKVRGNEKKACREGGGQKCWGTRSQHETGGWGSCMRKERFQDTLERDA